MAFFYIINFPQKKNRFLKIGSTTNLYERMKDLKKKYGKPSILFIHYTENENSAYNMEDMTRACIRMNTNLLWIPNDRFRYDILPNSIPYCLPSGRVKTLKII